MTIKKPTEGLTEREKEVIKLIVAGYNNSEAASRLGISRRTVEAHRARIMAKLRLDTLPALVRYAIRAKITSLDDHREY